MSPRPRAVVRAAARFMMALAAALALAVPASSAPAVGFVEEWTGTTLHGWTGGSIYSNPGTGGTAGPGDGYLVVATTTTTHLGAMSSGPEYAGDWLAAGITRVAFWLRDVGVAQPLEIHFAVGNSYNFWQYNTPFVPTPVWTEFYVSTESSFGWTQIIGPGTFADALRNVDRVLVRHDRAPYFQTPDAVRGDFGIDHLQLLSSATLAATPTWGRLKSLYR